MREVPGPREALPRVVYRRPSESQPHQAVCVCHAFFSISNFCTFLLIAVHIQHTRAQDKPPTNKKATHTDTHTHTRRFLLHGREKHARVRAHAGPPRRWRRAAATARDRAASDGGGVFSMSCACEWRMGYPTWWSIDSMPGARESTEHRAVEPCRVAWFLTRGLFL